MKVLLAALMCVVLTMTEAFAISGGPWDGTGHVEVTGTYAGVFVPPIVGTPPMESDNSIALFTVAIPKTGVGSGTVVVFRNGIFYSGGNITATADPDSSKLYALISASYQKTLAEIVDLTSGKTETFIATYSANGKISELHGVKIKSSSSVFSTAIARLTGHARITYTTDAPTPGCNPFLSSCTPDPAGIGDIDYHVIGFKQASL